MPARRPHRRHGLPGRHLTQTSSIGDSCGRPMQSQALCDGRIICTTRARPARQSIARRRASLCQRHFEPAELWVSCNRGWRRGHELFMPSQPLDPPLSMTRVHPSRSRDAQLRGGAPPGLETANPRIKSSPGGGSRISHEMHRSRSDALWTPVAIADLARTGHKRNRIGTTGLRKVPVVHSRRPGHRCLPPAGAPRGFALLTNGRPDPAPHIGAIHWIGPTVGMAT
jgi:hypothetical protein